MPVSVRGAEEKVLFARPWAAAAPHSAFIQIILKGQWGQRAQISSSR